MAQRVVRTTPWWVGELPAALSIGWSKVFAVSMAFFLVLSLALGPYTILAAAGGHDSLYAIPAPAPGVERTYDDTYRVLANNDVDIDSGQIAYDGYFANDYPILPTSLGSGAYSPAQALRYATTTDLYRTQVSQFSKVPYKDKWIPYSEWEASYTKLQFLRVHEHNTYDGPSSKSGEWFVRTTNQYGDWRPIYGAEVAWNETDQQYALANPEEALVHDSYGEHTISRGHHVTSQYLRYSDDPARVAVPMSEGRELYPTSSGASMPLKWGQGNDDTVEDAWVGITNVFDGAWYRDSYVVGNGVVGASIPFDYRAVAPEEFSQQGRCRRSHAHTRTVTRGNETWTETYRHIHNYDKTEWAKYRLIDSNAALTSVRLDAPGFDGNSEWHRFNKGTWFALHETTSRPFDYPPGEYILTATLRIETTVESNWGVTSSRCNEWERTTTDTYTMTKTHSVPVTMTDWDAANLEIDVAIVDGLGRDRVVIYWQGNQDLPGNAWEKIKLEIGNKTVHITAPWRFYPVSRNTHVEERTESGVTVQETTHTYGDRWPAIYHVTTSVANVSVHWPETDGHQEFGYWESVATNPAEIIPGTALPHGVIAPDNHPPTTVYHGFVGDLRTSDLYTGEEVTVEASTVFGARINESQITLSVVPLEATNLSIIAIERSETDENHRIHLRLTDNNGEPIPGRTVLVQAETDQYVTTNEDGIATVTFDGVMFRARFNGDVWYNPGDRFYGPNGVLYIFPTALTEFETVSTVGQYIQTAISDVLIFVEWIALGLFALWWVRTRRRPGKIS